MLARIHLTARAGGFEVSCKSETSVYPNPETSTIRGVGPSNTGLRVAGAGGRLALWSSVPQTLPSQAGDRGDRPIISIILSAKRGRAEKDHGRKLFGMKISGQASSGDIFFMTEMPPNPDKETFKRSP